MNAITNRSTDLVKAAASIVAAFVGNPNSNVKASDLAGLFMQVHTAISSTNDPVSENQLDTTTVAGMTLQPTAEESGTRMSSAARVSLEGSVVYADEVNFDPAAVWPEATEDQRSKFVSLIEKYHIQVNAADGTPISRLPVDRLVTDWKIFDPISGSPFTMLKRHLSRSYDLDINSLRIMFKLGDDFPQTAPLYSESKRLDAARSGLGKGSREEKAARAKARRVENAKANGRTVTKVPRKRTAKAQPLNA